jgi:O-antigen/teichoic acid export membrane protein
MNSTVCSKAPPVAAPAPKISVRSNFLWTLIGNVAYAGAQWAIVIVLAKWATPEIVGEYALGLAIAAPVLMLVNLQLRTVLATDVHQEYGFAHYLGFRLATTVGAIAIIAGIAACMHYPWRSALSIVIIGVSQAIEAVSDIYYGLLQLRDHMDRIAKSMMARAALSLPVVTLTLWATHSLLWTVIALAGTRLLVLWAYDTRRGTHGLTADGETGVTFWPPRWSLQFQRNLCALSLPLGIVALLLSLNTTMPRYFIGAYLGARSVGIFAALAFLPNSGSLLVVALGQAAFVPLARYHADNNLSGFIVLLLKLLGVGLVLGVGGILFTAVAGRRLLALLYRPEYAEHAGLLLWFMVSALLSYLGQLLGAAITAARYFRSQIPLFTVVNGAMILFCYLMIPRTGLEGAVTATVATMAVQLVGCIGLLWWSLRRTSGRVQSGCAVVE